MVIVFEKYKNDLIKIKNAEENDKLFKCIKKIKDRKFSPIEKCVLIHKKYILDIVEKISDESLISQLTKFNRKPFQHQLQARDFLLEKKKAILADDMGGGKTFSGILASAEVEGKKLVVCPSSLKYNWRKEIGMVTDSNVVIIDSEWKNTKHNEWTVINYDMLDKHREEILKEGFSVMVADEVHYCRTVDSDGKPKSVRAKNIYEISENIEHVFLLTGTPIVNNTKDLFLLLSITGHAMSDDYGKFYHKYCRKGNTKQEIVFERLKSVMLRRLKDEFVDLPKKSRRFIPLQVDLTEYQNAQEQRDEDNFLVYLNNLRKIVAYNKISHTISLANDILDKGRPVVIFTNYNRVVDEIMAVYGDRAVKITGSDNAKKRDQAKEAFQNGEKDVIVCNMIAGSTGLTLTISSDLIVNDMCYVPADHLQAEDRVHRIGQDKPTSIYYMYVENTIDEKMATMLESKIENMGKSIDNKEIDFLEALKTEME